MDKADTLNLKKRYLTWLYKITKEAQDKIERKFTQLEIDRFILKELEKIDRDKRLKKYICEFKAYIHNKEKEGISLKFKNKKLKTDYLILVAKLRAIEKAIINELGIPALKQIKSLYEKEMTERILRSAEDK